MLAAASKRVVRYRGNNGREEKMEIRKKEKNGEKEKEIKNRT
jgi:hypothetical protein